VIRQGTRIWVGQNSALRTRLIAAFHSSALGGHSGSQVTYHRVKKLFVWPGLKRDVTQFVQQCETCQKAKTERTRPGGLLQPLPIPQGAWQDVTMDFIEALPKSEGFDTILVVVDRFTKYSHFIPLKHPFTAPHVARAILDNVVVHHGLPKSIVSDRDKIFTSLFWKELFRLWDTKLCLSTSYHPQTDGQSERVNQCLEMYLRCSVHHSPKQWRKWLPLAQFWYNSSLHSGLGCSPFKALYGYDPPLTALPTTACPSHPSVDQWIQEQQAHTTLLKQMLAVAHNRMKLQADRKHSDRQFAVGEQVLLKLQPYMQTSLVDRPCPKLAFRFYGPYTVLARIGAAAYKLELPASSSIHPVFHVSQLKPFTPDFTPVYKDLPTLADLDQEPVVPEAILQRRLVRKGNTAVPQVLIKWTSLPEDAATWEDYYVVTKQFPDAVAWGQATSPGAG
jgi:hypothetical protein